MRKYQQRSSKILPGSIFIDRYGSSAGHHELFHRNCGKHMTRRKQWLRKYTNFQLVIWILSSSETLWQHARHLAVCGNTLWWSHWSWFQLRCKNIENLSIGIAQCAWFSPQTKVNSPQKLSLIPMTLMLSAYAQKESLFSLPWLFWRARLPSRLPSPWHGLEPIETKV